MLAAQRPGAIRPNSPYQLTYNASAVNIMGHIELLPLPKTMIEVNPVSKECLRHAIVVVDMAVRGRPHPNVV